MVGHMRITSRARRAARKGAPDQAEGGERPVVVPERPELLRRSSHATEGDLRKVKAEPSAERATSVDLRKAR